MGKMGFKIKKPRDEAERKKDVRGSERERDGEVCACVCVCQGQRAASSQGHGGRQPMSLLMQCEHKAKDYH